MPAVGRNDPCPCGSGRKYKRCCLDRAGGPAIPSEIRVVLNMHDSLKEVLPQLTLTTRKLKEVAADSTPAGARGPMVIAIGQEVLRLAEDLVVRGGDKIPVILEAVETLRREVTAREPREPGILDAIGGFDDAILAALNQVIQWAGTLPGVEPPPAWREGPR